MIDRQEIFEYAARTYGVRPDYPWARTPAYAILRHKDSRKRFVAVINITEDKLGLDSDRPIDALLLKCGPLMSGTLREEQGIYPAYHMNKEHWITVHLSSGIDRRTVFDLIDLSHHLTSGGGARNSAKTPK